MFKELVLVNEWRTEDRLFGSQSSYFDNSNIFVFISSQVFLTMNSTYTVSHSDSSEDVEQSANESDEAFDPSIKLDFSR